MAATGVVVPALGGTSATVRRARVARRSRWSARSPRTSWSTPASSPAPSRCRPADRSWQRLARRLPVERRQLHGGRQRRRGRRGRHRARRALDGGAAVAPVYLTYRTYQLFVGAPRRSAAAQERACSGCTRRAAGCCEREQAARASAEAARTALKDQFLAIVSHELRTPLNAILGWADMLRAGDCRRRSASARAKTIFDSAQRQAQLIDDLLDVARIMSGKLRLDRDAVDLRRRRPRRARSRAARAEAKGIRRRRRRRPVGRRRVTATPRGCSRSLSNLLSNAVKFTPRAAPFTCGCARRRHRANWSSPTPARAFPGISCPGCSSRSVRPTARRRACTAASGSASRSSSTWSRRTAGVERIAIVGDLASGRGVPAVERVQHLHVRPEPVSQIGVGLRPSMRSCPSGRRRARACCRRARRC